MGAAAYHLICERVDDVGDPERADLGGELRVKNDLQQQIAQLFAEALECEISIASTTSYLLLDKVRHERPMGLFAVPGAPQSQPRHDLYEVVPRVLSRLRGQRNECIAIDAESVACGMPGTIPVAILRASSARSSGGRPGKSKRIAEDA